MFSGLGLGLGSQVSSHKTAQALVDGVTRGQTFGPRASSYGILIPTSFITAFSTRDLREETSAAVTMFLFLLFSPFSPSRPRRLTGWEDWLQRRHDCG